MKTDLTTSIITALIGTVAAYFACTLYDKINECHYYANC